MSEEPHEMFESVKLLKIGNNKYYAHEDVADEIVGSTVKLLEQESSDDESSDSDILDLT